MDEMLSAEIWSIFQTSQGNAVLLRPCGLEITVPVFTGQHEMDSILLGREGLTLPRPLTHDLFIDMFRCLKCTLEHVEVHKLKDNIFYARLVISGGPDRDKPLIMDCRPCDAFALAVRQRCPILVSSRVVEQAGLPLEYFLEEMIDAGEPPDFNADGNCRHDGEQYLELLEQLNRAVAAEEYEQAAAIRDMLRQIEEGKE
jgi:bifunctional DNase/RNase